MFFKIPLYAGGLGKTKGSEKAPDLLLKELKNLNCSEKGCKIKIDERDIEVDNSNLEVCHEMIQEQLKEINVKPVFIGGDHSLTYSTFKSSGCDGILVFDAHPDLMQEFKPSTHENYLRNLISEGLNPKKVIIVGARDSDDEELKYIKEKGIHYFDMKKISFEGINEICTIIMEIARGFNKLYVSIDIDSVDPAFAPGTGHIEAGGLSSRELIYIIQRIKNLKNIIAWDLVEINPDIEERLTISLGAKILNEIS